MNTNPKLDIIFGRRSIRAFAPGEISDADIRTLLEAAMAAPSACATDPWRFVVVRDQATRDLLVEKLPYGKMLAQAALGIVVCGDMEAAHDHQLSYLLQDCSAAVENVLLAARGLGLGSCWVGVHPREDRVKHIKAVLGLPPSILPVAAIAIGRAAESKEPRTRYNADYVRFEKW